ncbi:MAG TPA: hypothetical protein VJ691_00005, partial [Vicinamibacterales bacterium]|nr:hypothetical protein [Vicinamibacterales bacterium]
MRYLAIALLLLVPVTANAQRPSAAAKYVQQVRERQGAPPSNVHRQRDQRDRGTHADRDRWPQTHRPRWKGQQFRRHLPFGSYYAVPSYGYGFGFFGPAAEEESYERTTRPEPERIVTTGLLRLEITPATGLDYYVDGIFIGNSSTLGTQFALNAGPRRIEIRAHGYKSLVFDTRIVAGSETTFRGSLEPLVQPLPPQASGNRVMYIIPGCYMGNARPTAAELR